MNKYLQHYKIDTANNLSTVSRNTQQSMGDSKVYKTRTARRLTERLPSLANNASRVSDSKKYNNYIEKAFHMINISQKALTADPFAHISIDDGYGDYAMSVFRKKDRVKRLKDVPTLFTPQFIDGIISSFPSSTPKQEAYKLVNQLLEKNKSIEPVSSNLDTEDISIVRRDRTLYGNRQRQKEASEGVNHLDYMFVGEREKRWVENIDPVMADRSLEQSMLESEGKSREKLAKKKSRSTYKTRQRLSNTKL